MTVASLALCKTLYELSGWDENAGYYDSAGYLGTKSKRFYIPAYNLGYLLRKLPIHISIHSHAVLDGKGTRFYKATDNTTEIVVRANTPEDAACKLAIELFKQGILKKEAV